MAVLFSKLFLLPEFMMESYKNTMARMRMRQSEPTLKTRPSEFLKLKWSASPSPDTIKTQGVGFSFGNSDDEEYCNT